MALPLIISIAAGAAGAAGVFGVWKIVKAVSNNLKAKDSVKEAKKNIDEAREMLEKARARAQKCLQKFGKKKVSVYGDSIAPFVKAMNQIKNIDLIEASHFTESLHCSPKELMTELQVGVSFAEAVSACDESGLFDGAMSAFGARASAAFFAVAASDVAIGGHTDVAAVNETLTWLGGGAIAAGVLGIVVGAVVLGIFGVVPAIAVIGPTLAAIGLVMGKRAYENFNCHSSSNLVDGIIASEKLETVASDCDDISWRVRSFIAVMNRLNVLMMLDNVKLTQIVTNQGVDYSRYDDDSKREVAKIVSTAKALKTMLDIAILTKNGSLNDESEKVLNDAKNFLKLN